MAEEDDALFVVARSLNPDDSATELVNVNLDARAGPRTSATMATTTPISSPSRAPSRTPISPRSRAT